MENRKKALAWWGSLTDTQKWENRNKVTILDGRTWQNLTGREIDNDLVLQLCLNGLVGMISVVITIECRTFRLFVANLQATELQVSYEIDTLTPLNYMTELLGGVIL